MFSSSSAPVVEGMIYDFDDDENTLKWKGVFVASLHKVSHIHPLDQDTITLLLL